MPTCTGQGVEHATAPTLEATARWTAAVRAVETAGGPPLRDSWAAELAGPEGRAWIEARTPESVLPIVAADPLLRRLAPGPREQGRIRQVVVLGAGLDTRAYRLPWPDGTIRLRARPRAVLAHKEDVLVAAAAAPRCDGGRSGPT